MPTRQTQFRCSHLLFDMDGTLVDSHAPTVRAYTEWANRYGLDPQVVLRESQGRRTIDSMRALAPQATSHEADALALMQREREDMEGVVEIPGAGALLRALPPERWAVVTSADRVLALARLKAAGLPTPGILVSAEDVTRGKPAPDGFRLGAHKLGADPRNCIVFEDAPAGVAAGLAAGSRVIAMSSTLSAQELGAEVCLVDMRGVSVTFEGDELVLHIAAGQTGATRDLGLCNTEN
jgi:mannitol-1-/sugar-/sorbitol-6-phosphatase